MNQCIAYPCQRTTGGCPVCDPPPRLSVITHPSLVPPRKALWEYTDDEIAREYHNRALKKLGDPSVGIGVPLSNGESK